ncbi:hypothetical protein BC827DRAFT_439199 [Russula dissimulans]|nr:hypothetical protein BC827DRAFT_439199 [Russula dissimulans]
MAFSPPPAHPYAPNLRAQSASRSALALRSLRGASLDEVASQRSIGSDYDSATAFASFLASPFDKSDASQSTVLGQGRPYVKHNSGITLILSGHHPTTALPLYPSGSVMSGMVALSKPGAAASVEVKLEGLTSVREIQGGGKSNIVFYSDQLITWSADDSASRPDDFSFRRVVPSFSDDRRLLPPSFDSRLSAIPGFRVSVVWMVVVTVTRSRLNPFSFFRRTARLSVPIGYIPRTRPSVKGPFPAAVFSSAHPCTSFVDIVPAQREHTPSIHTQIYLPHSQITPMSEAIPFRIVLSAPGSYLQPFLNRPLPSSFLSMGSSATPIVDSTPGPVSVHMVRRIGADPRETFVVVVGELSTSASATRGAVLGEGVLSQPEIGQDSISWWGEVRVELDRAIPGGFVSERLVVQDVLVLTLNVPGMQTHVFPFRQLVPIRLTTDLPGTNGAVAITEV